MHVTKVLENMNKVRYLDFWVDRKFKHANAELCGEG